MHRPSLRTLAILLFTFTCAGLRAQTYTIPVVFHVLHQNGIENISDAQVMDGFGLLNTLFDGGPGGVEPPFDALVADMDVEFCLATLAPDGTPTTGIERIETPFAFEGGVPGSYVGQWPPDRYLNIWVVGQTDLDTYDRGSLLPADAAASPAMDGIMIQHIFLGTTGTAGGLDGGTGIALMAGRYFGLPLLWEYPEGSGPCGDDGIADTPPCQPIVFCHVAGVPSCDAAWPLNDENIMTYSYCSRMFTLGQRERVHATLQSAVAQRNNLWSPANLAATGCGAITGMGTGMATTIPTVGPNPFHAELVVRDMPAGAYTLELFDALGHLHAQWTGTVAADAPVQVQLANALPGGAYVLRLRSGGLRHAWRMITY
jgi:hypothetical protein